MNLLEETIEKLSEHDLSPSDVLWVGNEDIKTTWDDFANIADVQYHERFGEIEVASDLKIVGRDFWLERYEYDGYEWWEFKQMPISTGKYDKLFAVTAKQANNLGFGRRGATDNLQYLNGYFES